MRMIGKRFRLTRPMCAVVERDGKPCVATIPENTVLLVVDSVHDRMLMVHSEREEMFVFAEDLGDRGALLEVQSDPE
jgi:hypothetical protein